MKIEFGGRSVDYQTTVQRKTLGLAGEQYRVTNRQENNQEEQRSPWFGFARFLFIMVPFIVEPAVPTFELAAE